MTASPSTAPRTARWPRVALAAALCAGQIGFGLPRLIPIRAAVAQGLMPTVWVAPLDAENAPGAGLLAEKFDESARNDLHKKPNLKMVGETAVDQTVEAGEGDPRVDDAERLRVAGQDQYKAGQHEGALQNLRAALELYEDAIASVTKIEAVVETLQYLGAVSLSLDYEEDARDFYRRAVAVDPELEPLVPAVPGEAELLEKERSRLLKKKPGGVQVTTVPAGATIRIDGVEVGTSPHKANGLRRGFHYVQASHDEAGVAGTVVKVKGTRPVKVRLELKSEVGPPPSLPPTQEQIGGLSALVIVGDVGPDFVARAREISQRTQAQYVVAGRVLPKNDQSFVMQAAIYGVQENQVALVNTYEFRADLSSVFVQAVKFSNAVAEAVDSFPFERVIEDGRLPPVETEEESGAVVAVAPVAAPITPASEVPAPLPPPVQEDDPEDPPEFGHDGTPLPPMPPAEGDQTKEPSRDDDDLWYTEWWVWTIAGAVVIGGAIAVGSIVDPPESDENFNVTVRW